ncbi:MAG TPA: ABC transporter substrate-binding protein [Rhodocyclaceae bacterium]|nr:ABC transporter substrate-binding protein [Rhodocyclaceae bacterium]
MKNEGLWKFMRRLASVGLAAALTVGVAQAAAGKGLCGPATGKPATGAPILVGAVVGRTGPDDFSAGARAAQAYFNCVNANGGIHGRPIKYLVADDQWNPEVAGQVASKLVKDDHVVALVGNGSFVEMTVNAKLYEKENVAVIASACAVRECFEAKNIASTNQGPVPSNITAVMWAVKHLGTKKVACIALNIPSNGVWGCDITDAWLKEHGYVGVPVLFDPASADLTSVMLQAVATGADTMLVSLPSGLAVNLLKVAQEQNLRDNFKWIAPTPLYKAGVPETLGSYWSGKINVSIELTPWDKGGPDAKRWLAVMDKYGKKDDPRDTFSQAGFVSANIFVDTLMKMDPKNINRNTVTAAIKGVKNYRTDLLCNPWYFGPGDRHQPNHAATMVKIMSTGFQVESQCFNVDGKYFDPIFALEKKYHLVGD